MGKNRRTIIFVDNSTGLTGGFKSMKYLILELSAEFNIVVVSPDAQFAQSQIPGAEHFEIPFVEMKRGLSLLIYPLILLVNAYRLKRIINRYNRPIVHMNDFYNLSGCVLKSKDKRIPLVSHVRLLPTSYLGPVYNFLSRLTVRYSDHIVCCSKAVFRALPDTNKKSVVYDALPVGEYIIPEGGKQDIILCLANYIPGKGQDLCLRIFREIARMNPVVRLKFSGGTLGLAKNEGYKAQLIKDAEKSGLGDRIEFGDFCENVDEEIRKAAVLLNCSVSESFSMVCLEGMINRTCVVTIDSGGPAELVTHNRTGLIFAPGTDAAKIAVEMNNLFENTEKRDQLALEGYRTARERFSIRRAAMDMKAIYEEL